HGTHHRGQAAAMIRARGHTPPPLDLIRFYRDERR
ncbi:MAG: DinB family protein, partial [Vicinamibacterales bacterium]